MRCASWWRWSAPRSLTTDPWDQAKETGTSCSSRFLQASGARFKLAWFSPVRRGPPSGGNVACNDRGNGGRNTNDGGNACGSADGNAGGCGRPARCPIGRRPHPPVTGCWQALRRMELHRQVQNQWQQCRRTAVNASLGLHWVDHIQGLNAVVCGISNVPARSEQNPREHMAKTANNSRIQYDTIHVPFRSNARCRCGSAVPRLAR